MIRAVLRDGKIQPLGSLPEEWRDGQELEVEAAAPAAEVPSQSGEEWLKECDEAAARITPEEWDQFNATLEEQDRLAKARMRREAGLG